MQNNIDYNKLFWKWFWATIILLLLIYIGLNIFIVKNFDELTQPQKVLRIEKDIKELQKYLPQLHRIINNSLNKEEKLKIQKEINYQIDVAFQPLYSKVDDFINFHYSIRGEYTEIYGLLSNEVSKTLNEKMFKAVKFSDRINNALNNIHNFVKQKLDENIKNIKDTLKIVSQINDNKEFDFILDKVLEFSKKNIQKDFDNELNSGYKALGFVGASATVGIVMAKVISKKISVKIAQKITAKIALKTGGKLLLKTAGGSGGAASGASAGLLCGPFAEICVPAGAVVGAIIGWFATDKVFIEVDKYLNKDEFKKDVIKIIDEEKQKTKNTITKIYFESINNILHDVNRKFDDIKKKSIKDIVYH